MAEVVQLRRLASQLSTLPASTRAQGTRARILTAALTLFAERGFTGTSIRDIGAEASLNSASLYSHFSSKEQILAELMLIGHAEHHAVLTRALMSAGTNPGDQLADLMRAHVNFHCDFARLAVVANAELHCLSAEAAAPAVVLRSQSMELLAEVLRRGQSDGSFMLLEPGATLAAIASLGIRAAHWFPSPEIPLSRDELADTYAAIALRMVGAQWQ